MVQGENTVVVQYAFIKPPRAARSPRSRKKRAGEVDMKAESVLNFEIRPLIAFRDYHSTTHENTALNPQVHTEAGLTTIQPYDELPELHFAHDACEIDTSSYWYRNFEYTVEYERGLDFLEDLFNPFSLGFDLNHSTQVRIIASTKRHDVRRADHYQNREIQRRQVLAKGAIATPLKSTTSRASGHTGDFIQSLAQIADQFIVVRGSGQTVIAGYHWFGDWGRDTMIALPGLTLVTGRPEVAKNILIEFSKYINQGMLPNRFPDAGEVPEYNTVDATLWFFEAVRSLLDYTNDYGWVRTNLYALLSEIIAWHVKGTRHNIHVDTDGLLSSGEPGVQLTWMDVKVGDFLVTPRHGKPVEIQALWYNALRIMEQLAEKFEDKTARKQYKAMAKSACEGFNRQFWNEQEGCLYDVVDGDTPDGSIRPNQVIAVSLSNSMVSKPKARSILRVIEGELLTPRGLRTLSRNDSGYAGSYEGNQTRRDAAYH